MAWLKSFGGCASTCILTLYMIYLVSQVASGLWLSHWSDEATRESNVTSSGSDKKFLWIYAAIGLIQGEINESFEMF
jgi:hypothetical protein